VARDPNRNKAQAEALYQALILERRHKLEAVALRMGIAASTLYGWAENEATLPAWAVPLIYDATGDVDLFRRLTGAAERNLRVETPVAAAPVSPTSLRDLALEVGAESGDFQRAVSEGVRDGNLSAADLERCAVEFEQLIERASKAGAPLGRRVSVERIPEGG
jgi:hypothetical protein